MKVDQFVVFMERNVKGFEQSVLNTPRGSFDGERTIEHWWYMFNEWLELQRSLGGMTEERIDESAE